MCAASTDAAAEQSSPRNDHRTHWSVGSAAPVASVTVTRSRVHPVRRVVSAARGGDAGDGGEDGERRAVSTRVRQRLQQRQRMARDATDGIADGVSVGSETDVRMMSVSRNGRGFRVRDARCGCWSCGGRRNNRPTDGSHSWVADTQTGRWTQTAQSHSRTEQLLLPSSCHSPPQPHPPDNLSVCVSTCVTCFAPPLPVVHASSLT